MRLFWALLKLALLIGVIFWVADQPGNARIVWRDYAVETSAAFLVFVALAVGVVFVFGDRFLRFVKEGPTIWRLRRELRRLREGQRKLDSAFEALAAGDAGEAGRLAVASRRLLGATSTTRLLQAQAAQMAGDRFGAASCFQDMAAREESAALGARGLVTAALRAGDWAEAERRMQTLQAQRPDAPWLDLARFELAVRQRRWSDAELALRGALANRLVEEEAGTRLRAALLLAFSDEEAARGRPALALEAAEKAARLERDWLPARLVLAQRLATAGHARAAARAIEKAWATTPHRALAALFGRLDSAAKPLETYRRLTVLARRNADAPETHLALAEAALAADLWGESRRHLMALVGLDAASREVFRLLARLERRESGDEQAAAQWLMKAADAPADPAWVCDSCGGTSSSWQALCPHCEAFSRLVWRTPGVARPQASPPPFQALRGTVA